MATLYFSGQNQKIEITQAGRKKLPDGEWTVLPSHLTFLVPLILPCRVLRRMGESQLRALVFDRIPLPADAARLWLLIPRLGFFSRGPATAWAVVSPLSALPANFDRCLPEDLLLTTLIWDKRFQKGGLVALDSSRGVTLMGISRGAKSVLIWKQVATSAGTGPAAEIPPALTSLLGQGSYFLRLNAGGPAESILSKYGTAVTEDAATALTGRLPLLMSKKNATLSPDIFAPPAVEKDRTGATEATQRKSPWPIWRQVRGALFCLAILLPCAALWAVKQKYIRQTESLLQTMQSGYEKRFGVKIPESLMSNPVLALRDKSRRASAADAATAVPLHAWLYLVDRLSSQAFASGLRLDAVSLDEVRVEIRGTAADLQSVARWVSNLSADPALADAALVSSETRMSDRRTAFKVRARVRLSLTDSKS